MKRTFTLLILTLLALIGFSPESAQAYYYGYGYGYGYAPYPMYYYQPQPYYILPPDQYYYAPEYSQPRRTTRSTSRYSYRSESRSSERSGYRSRSSRSLEANSCISCVTPQRSTQRLDRLPVTRSRRGAGELTPDTGFRGRGVRARTRDEVRAQQSPIWGSFIRSFNRCAPGCEPAQYASFGHRHGPSCHHGGSAIDVGAMICGGRMHRALDGGRFASMVSCMKGQMGKVLYRNGRHVTTGHHDHAHFSNGCVDRGVRMW